MAVGPIGGTCFFKIDGLQYQLKASLKIQPNMTQNEWEANQDLSVVFTQKAVVPFFEMDISDSGGLSIQQLGALSGVTMTAELINGKVYTLLQAAPWGEITDDTEKGVVKAKFGGAGCYEQLSG